MELEELFYFNRNKGTTLESRSGTIKPTKAEFKGSLLSAKPTAIKAYSSQLKKYPLLVIPTYQVTKLGFTSMQPQMHREGTIRLMQYLACKHSNKEDSLSRMAPSQITRERTTPLTLE
ncbi:hypothetical protein M9H77_30029 [Catharanthus roseus]|uniref:Uncharacterized protein n=1 Tax=Catharanthus roseus TaxID=4058 RepID=A0ACB9ZW19_CATRO|nr:hypothetical protein M9H77_30029 [Catharanthus roseus]